MDPDRDKLLEDDLKKNWIPHLQTQFKRGRPILFTGAGFSAGALNTTGEPIPGVASLRKQLWGLAFPGEEHDESASLQDLYEKCVLHHSEGLSQLLFKLYTVDENSLPAWYSEILRFPWQRFYTLNIDDLPSAVSRKFTLPRKIVPISAVDPQRSPGNVEFYSDLECVHLNGSLQDVPNHVTFSVTQYAERLAQHDPWYLQLSADLLTSPFIFIGTQLDELMKSLTTLARKRR